MAALLIAPEESLLLIIDVQEKLWTHIAGKERVRDRCRILLQGAGHLSVPVLVSEQYPKGLGPTLEELKKVQPEGTAYYEKLSFGCLGDKALMKGIKDSGRRQIIVCGIEAHVCVMQTVLEGLGEKFQMVVVADAIGSRDEVNCELALDRMKGAGAILVSTEMILFEWMRTARHPAFKAISALVK